MEEPSNHIPFRQFHSYGRQDSYLYNYLATKHRNSFEENLDKSEKTFRQESLDTSVGPYKPYRSHFFECLNNLE